MEIAEFNQDDVTVIEARGRIDSTSSRAFGERLVAAIKGGAGKVLVDLTHIAYISSTGFRALLIAGKQSDDQGCQFGLCGLNNEVRRLFEIGAFSDLFRIYSTRHEGIAKLST